MISSLVMLSWQKGRKQWYKFYVGVASIQMSEIKITPRSNLLLVTVGYCKVILTRLKFSLSHRNCGTESTQQQLSEAFLLLSPLKVVLICDSGHRGAL